MGAMLFISFLACLIKNSSDYAWKNKYNMEEEYQENPRGIDVGNVNVNGNFGNDDDNSDANSDGSYMTKAKSKRGAKSRQS